MVSVARRLSGFACGAQLFDGLSVCPAQVMKIGDVVLSLRHRHPHVLLLAELASLLVSAFGLFMIIQHDLAHCHVVQSDDQSLCVVSGNQLGICALVAVKSLAESVLAMEDVSDVDIKT